MLIEEILKAFLIGICASAPLGPIAILVIQKTLSKGKKVGYITSLGATLVDTIYAFIAIFALAFAQKIIETHTEFILIVGGIVVGVLGVGMATSDPFRKIKASDENTTISATNLIQAVFMGLSNPGAIFVIFTLFAFFGFSENQPQNWRIAPILLSVSAGSALYWYSLVSILDYFRKKFKLNTILWINRLTGAIIVIIGIVLFGEGIFRYFLK